MCNDIGWQTRKKSHTLEHLLRYTAGMISIIGSASEVLDRMSAGAIIGRPNTTFQCALTLCKLCMRTLFPTIPRELDAFGASSLNASSFPNTVIMVCVPYNREPPYRHQTSDPIVAGRTLILKASSTLLKNSAKNPKGGRSTVMTAAHMGHFTSANGSRRLLIHSRRQSLWAVAEQGQGVRHSR